MFSFSLFMSNIFPAISKKKHESISGKYELINSLKLAKTIICEIWRRSLM